MRDGSVILVTAASRGIGAGCARLLSSRGCRLALLARSPEIEAVAAQCGSGAGRALAVRGSVDSAEDLGRLVSATLVAWGRIDGAIVNTGHAAKGDVLALTDEEWQRGFELLLLPAIRLARILEPHLQSAGGGSIVHISSFAAREPSGAFPVSAVVRASLTAWTRLVAQRLAPSGIRVNSVLPGWVDNFPVQEADRARIPMGRPATTEEIARVAAFLLSDDARYVTGQEILVDGGLVRGI